MLASVADGVFLVDRHGDIRTWNRAAAAATGLPEEDVIDRRAVEAIPGWSAIAARVPIVAAGSGPPRAESLPLELGDRELWLSLHGVVVPDGIVYAFRDLTEERALETMRTEFVSTVSHELRTPLAAIYGAAMTLRRSDVVLDESQRATPARRGLGRGRPARANGQRHSLGEPARRRLTAHDDPGVRPGPARRGHRPGPTRPSRPWARARPDHRARPAARLRRPRQGRADPDQPRRQRRQVLTRRRPGGAQPARSRVAGALLDRRPRASGSRRPSSGASSRSSTGSTPT